MTAIVRCADEIRKDLRRRSEKIEFRGRQDFKDADAIRSVLECMEYDNHPLDSLSPEEWAALKNKLTA